jgi:hypothetical protein
MTSQPQSGEDVSCSDSDSSGVDHEGWNVDSGSVGSACDSMPLDLEAIPVSDPGAREYPARWGWGNILAVGRDAPGKNTNGLSSNGDKRSNATSTSQILAINLRHLGFEQLNGPTGEFIVHHS